MSTLQVNSRAEVVDANGTLQQHVGVIAVAATAIQIQTDRLRDLHADMQSMAEHVHRVSAEVIKVSLFQAIALQMSYVTKTAQCWRTCPPVLYSSGSCAPKCSQWQSASSASALRGLGEAGSLIESLSLRLRSCRSAWRIVQNQTVSATSCCLQCSEPSAQGFPPP